MKRLKNTFLFALIISCALAGYAFAESANVKTATFSGKGIIFVKADNAALGFSLHAEADTLKEASAAMDKTYNLIVGKTAQFGDIFEEYFCNYTDPNGRVILDKSFVLRTNNVAQTDKISALLVDAGASCVNYVNFSVEDINRYKASVLARAIADAQSTADAVGNGFTPVSVQENGIYSYTLEGCDRSDGRQVAVEADICVTFEKR